MNHEETDVLMVCHAIKEASVGQRIKVVSDDTDVLVIMAHHYFNNTKGLADFDTFTFESTDSPASQINVKESTSDFYHAKCICCPCRERMRHCVVIVRDRKGDIQLGVFFSRGVSYSGVISGSGTQPRLLQALSQPTQA